MEEIDVPPFFLCPISLQLMKDPVTVPTGITYDRESIEKWIFSGKNNNCPVTKQFLSDTVDLTPNITLHRLIQSWCTINASYGIERIPTPKAPINKSQILKLFNDANKSPNLELKTLQSLRSIAAESKTNKRCLEAAGVVEFLVSVLNNNNSDIANFAVLDDVLDHQLTTTRATDEALIILYNLNLSESDLKDLISKTTLFDSLTAIIQRGSYESRAYAVLLLKSMLEVADPMQIMTMKPEFFAELVQVLRDQISRKASKATLHLLIKLCSWGRNKIKAVEAGAVTALLELLLDCTERRPCEMMLIALDQLCGCADGRAELLKHDAGLSVVSKKILRISEAASERAVRILSSISRFSATTRVVQEMLELGVVAKLCLVLQVECGYKTKEKARDILKLHASAWMNSPCVPLNLLSSYPL